MLKTTITFTNIHDVSLETRKNLEAEAGAPYFSILIFLILWAPYHELSIRHGNLHVNNTLLYRMANYFFFYLMDFFGGGLPWDRPGYLVQSVRLARAIHDGCALTDWAGTYVCLVICLLQ